jgi:hypothetical protein
MLTSLKTSYLGQLNGKVFARYRQVVLTSKIDRLIKRVGIKN